MVGCATTVVNLYFLTRTTSKENVATCIAGFGLATLLVDVTFVSIGFGLNGALETFVSQASGRTNYALCSEYLHRSRVIVTLYFLVVIGVLRHAESIILGLG